MPAIGRLYAHPGHSRRPEQGSVLTVIVVFRRYTGQNVFHGFCACVPVQRFLLESGEVYLHPSTLLHWPGGIMTRWGEFLGKLRSHSSYKFVYELFSLCVSDHRIAHFWTIIILIPLRGGEEHG